MAGKSDGRRVARVEREVHKFVSQYLSASYTGDIAGFVSVARVKMQGDLRLATVSVGFIGADNVEQKEALIRLQRRAPEIQRLIGDRLPMKYCPKLQFEIDETTEKILKIENILKDLGVERAASEKAQAAVTPGSTITDEDEES